MCKSFKKYKSKETDVEVRATFSALFWIVYPKKFTKEISRTLQIRLLTNESFKNEFQELT